MSTWSWKAAACSALRSIGYAYGLEQAGIRFRSIGGTSAGAITACLLAAANTPAKPRAEAVLAMLGDLDMFSFVDGGDDAQGSGQRHHHQAAAGLLRIARAVVRATSTSSIEYWGMNPGEVFQELGAPTSCADTRLRARPPNSPNA
jgi:NTE family protein